MYCREAPSVVTCSASNRAWTPKTLPVRRWQARQWQIETRTGSPSTVSRSCPQLHAACRVLTSGIVDRVGPGEGPASNHRYYPSVRLPGGVPYDFHMPQRRVEVCLDPDRHALWVTAAQPEGVDLSAFVRRAVEDRIAGRTTRAIARAVVTELLPELETLPQVKPSPASSGTTSSLPAPPQTFVLSGPQPFDPTLLRGRPSLQRGSLLGLRRSFVARA
jgi:hypothetical protein